MLPGRSERTRILERVQQACAVAQDPLELLEHVAAVVRRAVPYAAAGWIVVDPDTMLMNGVYSEDVDRDLHLELIALELGQDDVNKFWQMARHGVAAAALSASTGGDLGRSARWARVYGPHGYGDELRAVFAGSGVAWGHACLTRRAGEPMFDPEEVQLLTALAPAVTEGIRRCYLHDDPAGTDLDEDRGFVVVADDGSVETVSPQVTRLLGAPDDAALESTIVLHQVAQRARALAAGGADGPPAMARTRSRDGAWLVVRGIRVADPPDETGAARAGGGRTAVVLEPAHGADLAPILLEAHGLTPREREVTRLLLHGMSTAQIAQELWISAETLRGHVKAVFAKLGVSSRPELAALLSHEPRLRLPPDGPGDRHTR
nr:helix-turn-helix transcriptional regulator [Ornithinimicrobium pekingense]